jgi:hypothetical protein
MKTLLGFLALLAITAGCLCLTALAIVAMRRDRASRRGSGLLSAAMLEVQSLFEPSKRHAVHSVRGDEPERQSEAADPPDR